MLTARSRRIVAVLAIVLVGTLVLVAPTACYLAHGAWEEARILGRRRPIAEIVADPATNPLTRAKLRIVEEARAFAHDSLGLATGKSFTTYSYVDRDTLVMVLSAAYRDRLEPYTWWFPIVGRVPYKGFFDFDAARDAAADLQSRGLDTYLRPSDAFSTLGFFNDPLLNTTLDADSLELANTVIHELTHNTFYAAGQVPFNESFASFVGARGAALFFRSRGDSAAARVIDERWGDEKLLAAFWAGLGVSLDSAFNAHPDDQTARLRARDMLYARARRELVDSLAPLLRTINPQYARRVELDNAALLAHQIYGTGLGAFDLLWARNGHDLRRTIRAVIALARANPGDPQSALQRAATQP